MPTTISRDYRNDDDPTVRDIAATVSTGGSTTGKTPDPRLKGPPLRPSRPTPVQLGTGPFSPVSQATGIPCFPSFAMQSRHTVTNS